MNHLLAYLQKLCLNFLIQFKILFIKQNAYKSFQIADKAYIMETGRITLTGKGKVLLNNDHVKKAHLVL